MRADARALRSIEELLTPAVITRATETYIARAADDAALLASNVTSTGVSSLALLATTAQRNGLDESVLWAIEDCRDREEIAAPQDCEMSATLLVDVLQGMRRWDALGVNERIQVLKMGMAAAMLAIQIVARQGPSTSTRFRLDRSAQAAIGRLLAAGSAEDCWMQGTTRDRCAVIRGLGVAIARRAEGAVSDALAWHLERLRELSAQDARVVALEAVLDAHWPEGARALRQRGAKAKR